MNTKFHSTCVLLLALLPAAAAGWDADASGETHNSTGVQGRTAPAEEKGYSAATLGITFIDGSTTTLHIERDGKKYLIDIATRTIHEAVTGDAAPQVADSPSAQPATDATPESTPKSRAYRPGDDLVFSLPTGRRTQRHGLYVNFSHRFPEEPAFHGRARGHELLGLDSFAVPSFGFRYGVTSRLAVSAYRSPFSLNRVIELGASYLVADEQAGAPFNLAVRASVDAQNDFQRNFTTNFEVIVARSVAQRAQFYLVPTVSLHNRPLIAGFNPTQPPPYRPCSMPFIASAVGNLKPCADTLSLGIGVSVDVRKTVALVAEVIPTVVNARDLGIHRPPYSFGIQKKIWRHAFTFGFTNGPGTTASQRSGTRATLLGNRQADKPSGLFVGFNLTRQLR